MAKKFVFKGKDIGQLKALPLEEFVAMLPARKRRSMKRGFTPEQQKLLTAIREGGDKVVRTHARDMIILPEMVEKKVAVYNGKEFTYITVSEEMIGHYLGEYSFTRKSVKHSAAGIGATRSTKFISVK